ncbi:hypothetical protein OK016_11655 [Vibrio chagasii]|nr:hypothetical protein [Vibrio chagasii]
MANVHNVFEELIGIDEEDANPIASHFSELWDMAHKPDVIEHVLEHDIAIANPPEAMFIIHWEKRISLRKPSWSAWRKFSLIDWMPKAFGPVHS